MEEKLFELLVPMLAGGVFLADIGAYLTDGTMPKRRRVGLFLSALIIIVGVCFRFKIPVLLLIREFIAGISFMEDVSQLGITVVTSLSICIIVCIIAAIFISVWACALEPLFVVIACIGLVMVAVALVVALMGVVSGGIRMLLGLRESLELYEILAETLTMGLIVGAVTGPIWILVELEDMKVRKQPKR